MERETGLDGHLLLATTLGWRSLNDIVPGPVRGHDGLCVPREVAAQVLCVFVQYLPGDAVFVSASMEGTGEHELAQGVPAGR